MNIGRYFIIGLMVALPTTAQAEATICNVSQFSRECGRLSVLDDYRQGPSACTNLIARVCGDTHQNGRDVARNQDGSIGSGTNVCFVWKAFLEKDRTEHSKYRGHAKLVHDMAYWCRDVGGV